MSSIKNLVQLASSENNVQLEDGDYFEVPAKPSEVSIIGQVHSPCTLLYRKGASIDSYLNYAGGLTGQADRNQIYILRIGGEAVPLKTLHRGRRSEPQGVYVASLKDSSDHTLMGTSLQPGDTIIVPAKLRIGKSRFKEMLDITYKTAVSVGAMISLFD
jgi:protein involved in polysaccharide export with SLBB domain